MQFSIFGKQFEKRTNLSDKFRENIQHIEDPFLNEVCYFYQSDENVSDDIEQINKLFENFASIIKKLTKTETKTDYTKKNLELIHNFYAEHGEELAKIKLLLIDKFYPLIANFPKELSEDNNETNIKYNDKKNKIEQNLQNFKNELEDIEKQIKKLELDNDLLEKQMEPINLNKTKLQQINDLLELKAKKAEMKNSQETEKEINCILSALKLDSYDDETIKSMKDSIEANLKETNPQFEVLKAKQEDTKVKLNYLESRRNNVSKEISKCESTVKKLKKNLYKYLGLDSFEESSSNIDFEKIKIIKPPSNYEEFFNNDVDNYDKFVAVVNSIVYLKNLIDFKIEFIKKKEEFLSKELEEYKKSAIEEQKKLTEKNKELTNQKEELTNQNNELANQNNELANQNKKLTNQNKKLTNQIEELTNQTNQNEELTKKNKKLANQKEKLTTQIEELTNQNEKLTEKNKKLATQIEELTNQNEELTEKNKKLANQKEKLANQIEELTNQTNQTNQNEELAKNKWIFTIAGGVLVAAGIAMSFLTFGFGVIPLSTAAAALSVAVPSVLGTALVTGALTQFAKSKGKMSKFAIAAITLGAAITLSAIFLSVFTFGLGIGAVALAGTAVAGLAIGIPAALGVSSIIAGSITYDRLQKNGYSPVEDQDLDNSLIGGGNGNDQPYQESNINLTQGNNRL